MDMGDGRQPQRPRTHLARNGAIVAGVTCAVMAGLYFLANAYVMRQAEANVENLLLSHKGMHHYVQQVMHPALYQYQEDAEIPETFYAPELFSSSFIIRNQHQYYNQERELAGLPPLYYKMAAINPRNPVNKADGLETGLIRMFNEQRQVERYRDVIKVEGRKYLYVALPFLQNTAACLHCHGRREDAPAQLRARYPGPGGFNEKEGDIRAIISIKAPLEREVWTVYIIVAALFAGFLTIMGLFFFSARLRRQVGLRTRDLEQEITDHRLAEEQLAAASERFNAVLDSMDALVYVADMATYELLFVNRYGREIFGDAMGKICWQTLQAGQDGPCPFCTNSRLVDEAGAATGMYVWEFQNLINHEWYECRDQAIPWIDGRLVRLEVATNITLRKNTEKEKKKLEEQLRQAQKMEAIGTLAGGIAHDFNNILTPILGYAEIVQGTMAPGSETWKDQQEIITAGARAKELVKQILTFSRQTEQVQSPIQIHLVVKEALKLLRSSLPTTIEIKQNIAEDCGLVMADPTRIHQVIMNLCTNAYHAMRQSGGTLAVSLTPAIIGPADYLAELKLAAGDYLRLEVSDTGCGMSPAVRERIFEPYFTTRPPSEGTGMGLSVVHAIVSGLGGHITVYSEPGQGTTFHVYLPIHDEMAAEVGEKAILQTLPRGDEHILVVDDEPTIGHLLERFLAPLGYQVTICNDPEQALELFAATPALFDLVITDMTMPHMTGVELAVALLARRPKLPIILCTGFSEIINEAKAQALGIRRVLMKPILKTEVATVVRTVLDASPAASKG
jgi:signal transduction histidine kinase/CheY-like chemotaxis protein/PAS domain-containing protein